MLAQHRGSRRQLYEYLARQGLSVEYAAVTAWYRSGPEETLAPETIADFELVATSSGMYSDHAQIALTFACIQRERVNRRVWARKRWQQVLPYAHRCVRVWISGSIHHRVATSAFAVISVTKRREIRSNGTETSTIFSRTPLCRARWSGGRSPR